MTSREISLAPRVENTRDAHPVLTPIQFSLSEIKQHFTESMGEVKAQFTVADKLNADGKILLAYHLTKLWKKLFLAEMRKNR